MMMVAMGYVPNMSLRKTYNALSHRPTARADLKAVQTKIAENMLSLVRLAE
jgi:hypothetical protein